MSDLAARLYPLTSDWHHPARQGHNVASRFLQCLVTLGLLFCVAATALRAETNSFAPTEADRAALVAAIDRERPTVTPASGITGITVPHHLLAADLVARGFWAASGGEYTRIIIIAPDHFHRIPHGFATNPDIAETIFGPVQADDAAIQTLLDHPHLFAQYPDLSREHGISALLPFVAHFFPQAEVVPIIASVRSDRSVWDTALPHLQALVHDKTLVIQSTDFSHFLPLGQAVMRDQQTLSTLATGDAVQSLNLWQPDHLDSRAAMYLQMALQSALGATHAVVANRSSVDFGGNTDAVTSYVTLLWHRDPAALSAFVYPDQQRLFLAGDTLLGRGFTPHLTNPEKLAPLLNTVLDATHAAPILLNLEGVLLGEPLSNADPAAHVMTRAHSAPLLRHLNVVGASLANNHSWDFGAPGRDETVSTLSDLDITSLEHGQVAKIAGVSIVAINLIAGRDPHATPQTFEDMLCALEANPPLVGFVHWGAEYTDTPTNAEYALADIARRCGLTALVGAHSHQAAQHISLSPSGLPYVFSLGNFVFDQSAARSSGALVEIRRFAQGTIALRRVPLPHLFQMAVTGPATTVTLP